VEAALRLAVVFRPSFLPAAMRLLTAALLLLLAGCERALPIAQPPPTAAPSWIADAVLYEIFVPDFSPEGTFAGVEARLDSLQALGATTLWFMPIHPTGVEGRKGDALGSPYAIRDYYAVNPDYGTMEEFERLVAAVHARGMQIILDFVANHTAPDHAWTRERPDWYIRDADGNPRVPHDPSGNPTDWTDTVELDYDNPDVAREMTNVLRFWAVEKGVDGFRCDVASFVPLSFWEGAIASLRAEKPVLMLAEGDDPELHRVGFDLTYAWPEFATLKEVFAGAPAARYAERVGEVLTTLPDGAGRMRFTTNHDESAWDAPPPVLFGGQQGAQAAFVLSAALPGVPLLYAGQETGIEDNVPFFEATPVDWNARPEVQAWYRRFFDIYTGSQALRGGDYRLLSATDDALAFERARGNERLVVLANVRPTTVTIDLEAQTGRDLLSGETVDLGPQTPLAPYAARIVAVGAVGGL
jgi:glycosidase